MIISSDTFASVVNYLASIGGSNCSILFTPWMGRVHASIKTASTYARYEFMPVGPLDERFAVKASAMRDIAKDMEDADLKYRKGSQAQFTQETSSRSIKWGIPFHEISDECGQPKVESVEFFQWDSSLIDYIRLAKQVTKPVDRAGCHDCIFIEVRATDRVVVATDQTRMVVCRSRLPVDAEIGETKTRFLIANDQINTVVSTCESDAQIRFRVGYHSFSVECGNRVAVMQRRTGKFHRSWEDAYDLGRGSRRDGEMKIDRKRLRNVLSHVGGANDESAVNFRPSIDGVEAVAVDEKLWSTLVQSESSGEFGPFNVNGPLFADMIDGWPSERMVVGYLGPGLPIVAMGDGKSDCMGLIMPMEVADG